MYYKFLNTTIKMKSRAYWIVYIFFDNVKKKSQPFSNLTPWFSVSMELVNALKCYY
jgi:hypothetical protein